MNYLAIILLLVFSNSEVLFDFKTGSDLSNWRIVDDVVMGGRSAGHFEIDKSGHAVFYGDVSTENNGGFSSVRYQFPSKNVEAFKKIIIRLKGDGKRYQFRVKSDRSERQSYITYFETSGKWENIEISLKDLTPSWRGMPLDMPNFPAQVMEELAFLISNKKSEKFKLEIDSIVLK